MRVVVVAVALLSGVAFAQPAPKTEDEKTIYALGLAVGQSVRAFNMSKAELEIFRRGSSTPARARSRRSSWRRTDRRLSALAKSRQEQALERLPRQGEKEPGAHKTRRG